MWTIQTPAEVSLTIASRFGAFRSACAVATLFLLLAPSARAQTESKHVSAVLEVTVCDTRHRPVSPASVTLERKTEPQPIVGRTDSEGRYRVSGLPDGTYIVHAESAGYREARNDSVVVRAGRVASVVLLLEPSEASSPSKTASSSIEYSDEPQFTVAGVTDPTNFGAHGSDAGPRRKEELAKDTAALNRSADNGRTTHSPASPRSEAADIRSAPRAGGASEDERVGKLLLGEGKSREALPYLERAAKSEPNDYDASYNLALACEQTLCVSRADQILRTLLGREDRSEVRELLADVLEHEGRAVEAEREYERAAGMDPSEPNLFAWGAELLLHRAYLPAAEVFQKGHLLFPKSVRMLIGLGVASYDGGPPEKGVRQLMEACDVDPHDPEPYLFLGKIEDIEDSDVPEVLERLKRFVRLHPENALSYYDYALRLAKLNRDVGGSKEVENLLLKSVTLDPHLGDAYLHLGIVYAERKDFQRAVSAYQKAIENTQLPAQAHFRLAQLYRQMGKPEQARREIKLFDAISKQQADDAERNRHEMGQFLYTLRSPSPHVPASAPQ